jgi:hypothetical protein
MLEPAARQKESKGELMTDFFDRLKQGVNKGLTTASVRSKELLDANRVKSEIAEVEQQRQRALGELGASVCSMLDSGGIDDEALKTARAAIARLEEQINEKQREVARIHSDAEQALAGGPPAGASQGTTCVCGATIPAGAAFCGSCGRKIELPGPRQSQAGPANN